VAQIYEIGFISIVSMNWAILHNGWGKWTL